MTRLERNKFKRNLERIRNDLHSKYDNGLLFNRDRIDYVVDNVLCKQLEYQNSFEIQALQILSNAGISNVKYQEPIPIFGEGGKLEHLYIADILVNDDTIIEIDGSSHTWKNLKDSKRDENTQNAGYITKRFTPKNLNQIKDLAKELKSK